MAVAGSSFYGWLQNQDAHRERERADEQRQRADRYYQQAKAVDPMLTMAADRLRRVPHMTALRRELLQEVVKSYEGFLHEESTDAKVREETGQAYLRIGKVHNELGDFDKADTAYEKAEGIFAELARQYPERAPYRADLIRAIVGPDWNAFDKPEEGERRFRRAMPIQEELGAQHPSEPEYQHDLANLHSLLASALSSTGHAADAKKANAVALAIQKKLVDQYPASPAYRQRLAGIQLQLGSLLRDGVQHRDAEKLHKDSLEVAEKLVKEYPDEPDYRKELAVRHYFLGILFAETDRPGAAEESYQRAQESFAKLSADFPSVPEYQIWQAQVHRELGRLLGRSGKLPEAEKEFRASAATYRNLAADHPTRLWNRVSRINMSQSYGDLGETLQFMGRLADARDAYSEQQKVCEAAVADYPSDGLLKNNLAATFKGQAELFHRDGQLKEAKASYRKGVALQEKLVEAFPADPLYRRLLGQLNFGLANALTAEDHLAEAEQHYRRGVELFERLLLEDQPLVRYYRNELARCLATCPAVAVRNPARALTLAKQAVEAAPEDALCRQTLGIAQYRADDAKAALQTLVESVNLSKGGNPFDAFYLALTLQKLGRTKDAQARYNDGLRMLGKQPIVDGELRCLRSEVAAVLGQEQVHKKSDG